MCMYLYYAVSNLSQIYKIDKKTSFFKKNYNFIHNTCIAIRVQCHVGSFKWSTRDQLVLASAIQLHGDQNWAIVSQSIKPLVEGPTDYYSHQDCASQYATMIQQASEKPKSGETSEENLNEQIVRQLREIRLDEINKTLAQMKSKHQ